jgi:hypothetical protein
MDSGDPGSRGGFSGERRHREIVDADDDLDRTDGGDDGRVDRGPDLGRRRPVPGDHMDLDELRPDPDALDTATRQVGRDLTETAGGEGDHVWDGEDRGGDEIRIGVGESGRPGGG